MTDDKFTQSLDVLWNAKIAQLPPGVEDGWRGMGNASRLFGLQQASGDFPATVKPGRIRFELTAGRIFVFAADMSDRELSDLGAVNQAMQAFIDAFVRDCEKHLSDE
jgi:hypothetical protein